MSEGKYAKWSTMFYYRPVGGFQLPQIKSEKIERPCREFSGEIPEVPEGDDIPALIAYINELATIYQGSETRLDHIGSMDPETIKRKAVAMLGIVSTAKAGSTVLNEYTKKQIEQAEVRRLPRVARAMGQIRRARQSWLDWCWR